MNALTDNAYALNVEALTAAWLQFNGMVHLRPLETRADYDHAISLLTKLWEVIGESKQHPLLTLRKLLDSMVMAYESIHYPKVYAAPHELLQFLIEEGEWQPDDLAAVVDSVALGDILAGRLDIDEETATRLEAFFKVGPHFFLKRE